MVILSVVKYLVRQQRVLLILLIQILLRFDKGLCFTTFMLVGTVLRLLCWGRGQLLAHVVLEFAFKHFHLFGAHCCFRVLKSLIYMFLIAIRLLFIFVWWVLLIVFWRRFLFFRRVFLAELFRVFYLLAVKRHLLSLRRWLRRLNVLSLGACVSIRGCGFFSGFHWGLSGCCWNYLVWTILIVIQISYSFLICLINIQKWY